MKIEPPHIIGQWYDRKTGKEKNYTVTEPG